MFTIFGYSAPLLFGQLLLGLINGAFYALLSLGLAVIFGMLNIINFAHGALFMVGAFVAWMLQNYLGLDYWWALLLAPLSWARRRGAGADADQPAVPDRPLYGLLLTFGLALILEGLVPQPVRLLRLPYRIPQAFPGGTNLGFMFMPNYRGWVVVVAVVMCLAMWLIIEKTRLGAKLRAATENPGLVQAFGVNVPRHDHADLWRRAWRWRRSPGCWRRRSTRSTRTWAPTSSSWCSPSW